MYYLYVSSPTNPLFSEIIVVERLTNRNDGLLLRIPSELEVTGPRGNVVKDHGVSLKIEMRRDP